MNPDSLVFVVGCAMYALGVATHHVLIHCPDRRNRQQVHAAEIADAQTTADAALQLVARAIKQTEDAKTDVEWARIVLAATQADADLHAETHCCLPTLAGIRAGGAA